MLSDYEIPEYLYHGTQSYYMPSILKNGLDPYYTSCWRDKSQYWNWTCLTDIKELARDWVGLDYYEDGNGVVLQIPTKELNPEKYCLEAGLIIYGSMPHARDQNSRKFNREKTNWKDFLAKVGVVGYTDKIEIKEENILYGKHNLSRIKSIQKKYEKAVEEKTFEHKNPRTFRSDFQNFWDDHIREENIEKMKKNGDILL